MKVLYIVPSLADAAPINIAKQLAEYCVIHGDEVEVAYFDDICGVTFPCRSIHIDIHKPIEFDAYDIIHTHMRRPDEYIAKNKALIKKAKTISTIHCDIFEDLKYSYGYFIARLYTKRWINNLRRFDYTVQVSEFLMKKYEHDLKNNFLIHNGVKVNNQDSKQYLSIIEGINSFRNRKYKILLSYSSLIKRKGLSQVIYALAMNKELSYICIGSGDELINLKRIAQKLNVENRVMFYGHIDKPYNIVPLVDLVIVPSYSESFCLSLHEAGMKKASVVCSNISAFTDAFTDEEVTFFNLNNTMSLINSIDEGLHTRKGMKLYEKEMKLYSQDLMLNKYYKLYKKITEIEDLE